MTQVQQIDRDAACDYLRSQGRDVEHDSHAIVQLLAGYRTTLANIILTDWNLQRAMAANMCCNGVDCGCQGATVGDYLKYQMIDRSE